MSRSITLFTQASRSASEAFRRLVQDTSSAVHPSRALLQTVLQVTVVLLGMALFTGVLLVRWLDFVGDRDGLRMATLVGVAAIYAGLYVTMLRRQAGVPNAWGSVALLVLEFALLSLMLPMLVHQATLLLPRGLLVAFAQPDHLGLELLVFVAVLIFALRGWTRHAAKAREAAIIEVRAQTFRRMAMEDQLTGLPNRRSFEERVNDLLKPARTPRRFCLLMIDVNRFKWINDTFSHNTGDAVLREIGSLLRQCAAEGDFPARLAGDEFVVLLQAAADEAQVLRVSRQLEAAVEGFDWTSLAPGLEVSISVGAARSRDGDSLLSLLQRSDQQMYDRKRALKRR